MSRFILELVVVAQNYGGLILLWKPKVGQQCPSQDLDVSMDGKWPAEDLAGL